MPFQLETRPRESLERALRALAPCGPALSLVDVVLLACDVSEDATEIDDLVAGVIRSATARILPQQRDPMLARAV